MKKVVALLLALVMVFSMAACAKAPAQDSSTKNPQAEGPAEQSKSNTDTKESEKPVVLHLVMFGDLTPRREEYMKGEFHDKVLDELNFDLTVEFCRGPARTSCRPCWSAVRKSRSTIHLLSQTSHKEACAQRSRWI